MADLGEIFDPNEVPEDDRSFDPIPAGLYTVQVTESEVVKIKSGNGQSLVLTLEIVDGPYANRKIWDRLNIRHTNEQAQSIAQRALADLFLATETRPSRESSDLHYKPCLAKVVVIPAKGEYSAKNEVKGYKPRNGATAPPAQKASPAAARPAAAGKTPWRRTA